MTCENCIKKDNSIMWLDFIFAIPIALVIIALFILLQKSGLVDLVNSSQVSYGTAFIIGLIASVSSCMAVVGGLVLSMSANFAKEGDRVRPSILFHLGRLISFFLLGGVVGFIGSNFQLGGTGTFFLSFIVAIVLILLGFNLLDVFSWAKKLPFRLPNIFSDKIQGLKTINHTLTPILIGIVTFFLPCGFTQSMQIYTLSTGSFWTGAFTMLAFALGTLPVLIVLSFSTSSIQNKSWSGVFFKTVGLVVIFFGLFNLYNSLNIIGINYSTVFKTKNIITISTTTPSAKLITPVNSSSNVGIVNGVQIIELKVKGGYSPQKSVAQANVPTIIKFETNATYDCSSSIIIPSLNITKYLPQTGSTDINIGSQSVGIFRGSCGMGMYPFEVDFR
jgi:sulfite exporter TauE/SafE